MKTIITSILVFLFCSMNGQSDINFEYNQSIKFHPSALAMSGYQLSYERYLNNRKRSFVVSPTLLFKEGSQESRSGIELMGQYRFYLSHLNRDEERTFWGIYNFGFYSGVYGLGYYLDETYTRWIYNPDNFENEMNSYDLDVQSFEIGTLLGIQIDFTKRIVLDVSVGGGIRKSKVEDSFVYGEGGYEFQEYSSFDPSYTGVKAKFGLSLGITL